MPNMNRSNPDPLVPSLDHWAMPFSNQLAMVKGLGAWFGPGFDPARPLTRTEFARVLVQCFDLPRPWGTFVPEFPDVARQDQAAIAQAVSMGFLTGYPDGTFRPQAVLKRFEVLEALVRGLGLSPGNPAVLRAFRDYAQIPSTVMGAIAAATQHHLVVTQPQVDLRPLQRITWGEMAAFLHQALVLQGELPVLAAPGLVDPLPYLPTFSDVQNHWAKPFIQAIANLGYIHGSAQGQFFPDQPLNRAQFALWIQAIFHPSPRRPRKQFFDVPSHLPAAEAIQQGYQGCFFSGFPDHTFQPQQPLRRVHLLVAIAQGLRLPPGDIALIEHYADYGEIPPYAQAAVAAALQAKIGVLPQEKSMLKPQAIASRAEGLVYCHQALVYGQRLLPLTE
ncbi:S-layer homology domain-containing protein [Synechococcus sp. BDU 130192]|uniref:S-layer homology domain-containing protein n=1 Tax=Synechococcus sp. BDU 130192 TaxID=2042059 RepID=UPI000C084564|nr:S-layer homology domain-containing protein [Synechococcus sp. BDU 130192]